MNWKKLLESTIESVNADLQLRNAYLMAENRILRNQINGRVQLTNSERKELAELGATLGKKALEEAATVAKPDTVLVWHRTFADQQMAPSELRRSVGRPRVDQEIEDVVVRMARENRSWGYDRIAGALANLGHTISDQTVGNILKRQGLSPAPERKKTVTWREFVQCHLDVLLATDFFNSEMWSGVGLLISFLLCFIPLVRQQVHAVGRLLHQRTQQMGSFVLHALHVRAPVQGWGCWIQLCARSGTIRCGEGLPCTKIAECIPDEERQPYTQDRGKVVCVSAARSRQIRDGPGQRRQWFDGLLTAGDRKAA
jgi:transposase